MIGVNLFVSLLYVSKNRNDLIYSNSIKKLLPAYRFLRGFSNDCLDMLYLFEMKRNVGIPQYVLEIKPEDLRKLNENLPDSISDEIFDGAVWLGDEHKETVPAKFIYNGKEYKVDVRYRGMNPNHWTREKRSWQIKFDKDNLFEGLRVIKLILPDDRKYFVEHMNNYRAKKFGLAFPEAKYSQLKINNGDHSVYYQIDDWSKEFLEKNKLPSDTNFYVTEEEYGLDNYYLKGITSYSAFDDIIFWKKEINDKIFNFENYSELDFLLNLLKQDNFSEIAENIIDLEKFYKWQMVSILAGSDHQDDTGNLRLYFNNVSGKFEFMPWDVSIGDYSADWASVSLFVAQKIHSNPNNLLELNKMLWEYVSNKDNLEDDLDFYDNTYNALKSAFYADFKKHDNNFTFDSKVKGARKHFENHFEAVKELLKNNDVDTLVRYNDLESLIAVDFKVNNFSGLKLQSIFLSSELVYGGTLYFDSDNDGVFSLKDKFVSSKLDEINYFLYPGKHTLFIKLNSFDENNVDISEIKFDVVNAVTSKEAKIKDARFVDISTFNYFSKIDLTPEEFVAENKIFSVSNGNIILRKGGYYIAEDIIVPKNTLLRIEPGTRLFFKKGVSLISYSPIEAVGTEWQPIIFQSSDINKSWGVVGVLNCGEKESKFVNTRFSNGGEAYINGVYFSGMLSSYHSNLKLADSIIENAKSEDGLNLKYAGVEITNSRFTANSSDAIDLDYATGILENNFFDKNGNDGIDLSGSSVLINNNKVLSSGDKCISIGEKSENLVVSNNILDGCKIGIEVKDASTPRIIDNVIQNNEIGINAYLKKPIFIKGGLPEVYNTKFQDNGEKTKADEFSKIEIYD